MFLVTTYIFQKPGLCSSPNCHLALVHFQVLLFPHSVQRYYNLFSNNLHLDLSLKMAPTVSDKVQTFLAQNAELSKTWGAIPTMTELRALGSKNGGAVAVCAFPLLLPPLSNVSTASSYCSLAH